MRRLFLICGLVASSAAHAQSDSMSIIAASGGWVALRHTQDGGVSTDVCVAAALDEKLAFRSDASNIEIRTTNHSWNMTVGQSGDVEISTGKFSKSIHMAAMDTSMLTAIVDVDTATAILDALDTASSATLTFGGKTKEAVSLSGSTKVLNAFRACSSSSGFATLGTAKGAANSPF